MITTTHRREAAPAVRTLPKTSPYQHGVVMTRTPLRISLAGGGTDLNAFYEHEYGQVFSTAINVVGDTIHTRFAFA